MTAEIIQFIPKANPDRDVHEHQPNALQTNNNQSESDELITTPSILSPGKDSA